MDSRELALVFLEKILAYLVNRLGKMRYIVYIRGKEHWKLMIFGVVVPGIL